MHNWVQNLLEFCHVSHGTALLRVTASHRHYMRPRYLMYVYPSMYIKYVRARMRAHAQTHSLPCCRLALSCRKTPVLKLGMEVKDVLSFSGLSSLFPF